MATFIATQAAPEALERAPAKLEAAPDRRFACTLVSALTLLALLAGGYHPYAEDGGLYLAGVKRLLDPALYPAATAFVLEPTRHSLFAPLVAELVRLSGLGMRAGLPILLLALHLGSIWTTLFAAWMLAARCWTSRKARAGATALLACWLGLPVAGTALLLMDPYLTARSFSTPCMVLALVGALDLSGYRLRDGTEDGTLRRRSGFVLWAASLTLAAAMHPLMAAYAAGASLLLLCIRDPRRGVRLWGTVGLCAAAMGAAAGMQSFAPVEPSGTLEVALTRSYWFLAEWRWYEWLGLAAPLAILAWFSRQSLTQGPPTTSRRELAPATEFGVPSTRPARRIPEARTALCTMALAAGLTAIFVALLFARAGAPSLAVARLQPMRVFQTVYLVMVLALGATLGERVLRRAAWRWAVATLALGGTMLLAVRSTYPDSPHLELPGLGTRNPWVQAFLWIRDNTPRDALFALDADYINAAGEDAQCFRAIAERSALPDYSKDGGEASIAPRLTEAWAAGQAAQQRLSRETDAERERMLAPLGVSWLVLDAGARTSLACPYRNAAVKVCRLFPGQPTAQFPADDPGAGESKSFSTAGSLSLDSNFE